jgi:hypothetical protein
MPFTATFTFENIEEMKTFLFPDLAKTALAKGEEKPVEKPAKPHKPYIEPTPEPAKGPVFPPKETAKEKAEKAEKIKAAKPKPAPRADGITYDDVAAATNELIRPGVADNGGGRDGIMKILKSFNAYGEDGKLSAKALKEDQWPDYIAKCKAVVAAAVPAVEEE